MIIPAFFSALATPKMRAIQHPAVANATSLSITPHDLRVAPVDMGIPRSYHHGMIGIGQCQNGVNFSMM
jgi:hypothetical protein